MKWTRQQIEDIWKEAEGQSVGVAVQTDSPVQVLNDLVEVRLDLNRPELYQFTIHVSLDRVWVLRGRAVKTDGEYEPMEE